MTDKDKWMDQVVINKTEDVTQYIKLIKNSRGYNWEIKINNLDVAKLEELNKEVESRFSE